jgi:catechol 2,3-dioxygenase-like lactoylglutathione lyase family enzyme
VKVKRIVANVGVSDPAAAKRFYQDILGLDVLMDMGWIATYGSPELMPVQVSFMTEGGSARRYLTYRSKSTTSTRRSLE